MVNPPPRRDETSEAAGPTRGDFIECSGVSRAVASSAWRCEASRKPTSRAGAIAAIFAKTALGAEISSALIALHAQ